MLLMLGWAVASCGGDGCNSKTTSIPTARLFSMSTKKMILVDSLTVYGIGAPGDSMILHNAYRVSDIPMPFRYTAVSTQFVIHYEQKAISHPSFNDTLTFKYELVPIFDSSECGVIYAFDIVDYKCTKHLIDSISVPNKRVTNVSTVSVMLYMHTAQ